MGEKPYTAGSYEGVYPAKDVGIAVIPCIFPCCREFSAEKGSLETGSSASQIEMGPSAPFLFDT